MRPFLIAATAWPLLCCSPAFAQVGTLTPSLGVTSSLGTAPGAPVGPNGLQVGASPTDARHRGNFGNINVVGSIDVDGHLGDVGSVDVLRNAGDVGIDGNVRLRLEQHCCIVEPNVTGTRHDERRRSSRSSVGIHGDWQSRG